MFRLILNDAEFYTLGEHILGGIRNNPDFIQGFNNVCADTLFNFQSNSLVTVDACTGRGIFKRETTYGHVLKQNHFVTDRFNRQPQQPFNIIDSARNFYTETSLFIINILSGDEQAVIAKKVADFGKRQAIVVHFCRINNELSDLFSLTFNIDFQYTG